jgi:hypothetical protein
MHLAHKLGIGRNEKLLQLVDCALGKMAQVLQITLEG